MTFHTELNSWLSPTPVTTSTAPQPGDKAPESDRLPSDGKIVVTFLRHCGCPFAEKTFVTMRELADSSSSDVKFIAVSHSDENATQNWLREVGGPGKIQVIVDDRRDIYAAYGLGVASFWHVLNPWALGSVFKLAREGTSNRPTESGNRWQTSGTYAIKDGTVVAGGPSAAADDLPDFDQLLQKLNS